MSQSIDRATVASMKKAVVRYKRTNLNQAKMRKPQLQSTLRALGVQSVPTVATRKRVKKAAPKRTAAQRLAFKKRMAKRAKTNAFNSDAPYHPVQVGSPCLTSFSLNIVVVVHAHTG